MTHASPLVVFLIALSYWIFALQVVWMIAGKKLDIRTAGALVPLIAVFITCAITGYIGTLVPNDWAPYREGLHWVLAFMSFWLVLSNQARVISDLLISRNQD